MRAREVQKVITRLFHNYEYKLYNTFIFSWESDFFAISKSGYTIEVEIKISKSDFKADFKKEARRGLLKHDALMDNKHILKPNKFFFAFPKGLIEHKDIPQQYGIIETNGYSVEITRNAKFLHKIKILDSKYYLKKLLNKFYYRNIDLRIVLNLKDYDLKYNQKYIDL